MLGQLIIGPLTTDTPMSRFPEMTRRNKAVRGSQPLLRLALFSALANVALPASAVVTGPLLARALGPVGRGQLAEVLNPLALATLVFGFGLPEALVYRYGRGLVPWRRTLNVSILFGAFAGTLACIVIAASAPLLVGHDPAMVPLLRMLSPTLIPIIIMTGLRGSVQAIGGFGVLNRERWAVVFLRLALLVLAAVGGVLTVTTAAWIGEGVTLAGTTVLVAAVIGHRAEEAWPTGPTRPFREDLSATVAYGFAAWWSVLAGVAILRLDQLILGPLAGSRELGFYVVAVSLAEIPAFAVKAVRDIVLVRATGRDNTAEVARACRSVVAAVVVVSASAAAVTPLLLPLLFGHDFRTSVPMAQLLFLAAVPASAATVLGAASIGSGLAKQQAAVQAVALVVTVVLLLALAPSLGGIGAALASIAAYSASAGLNAVLFARDRSIGVLTLVLVSRADLRWFSRKVAAALSRGE